MMEGNDVSEQDKLNMHRYLMNVEKTGLEHIAKKLRKNPELLEKAKQAMEQDKPYEFYIESGLARQVSRYIGMNVHSDKFIKVMAQIVDIPNHKELFKQAQIYRIETDPKEYYKKGFDMDF